MTPLKEFLHRELYFRGVKALLQRKQEIGIIRYRQGNALAFPPVVVLRVDGAHGG